jgi:hypothetical protein
VNILIVIDERLYLARRERAAFASYILASLFALRLEAIS